MWRRILPLLAPVLVGVVACSSGPDEPLTGAALVARGDELYHGAGTCQTCHGVTLEGTTMGPSFFDESFAPSRLPDKAFDDAVDFGVKPTRGDYSPMPALPTVDQEEVDAIRAYIRSEQRARGLR